MEEPTIFEVASSLGRARAGGVYGTVNLKGATHISSLMEGGDKNIHTHGGRGERDPVPWLRQPYAWWQSQGTSSALQAALLGWGEDKN